MMVTKLNLNRVDMPRQSPVMRVMNYDEVALGYTDEQAMEEAQRCLQCPTRPCVEGCPVGVDIPEFISQVAKGNMPEALRILKSKNSLPAICGRVCPQETQCESKCTLAEKGAPIAIGRLERYVADWELADIANRRLRLLPAARSGKRVAVVGAGPAGLTVAADLAKQGHHVVIFEALHVGGGVLVYGIPEFRLPKAIVQAEIEFVKSLGVELVVDWVIGKTATVDDLLSDGFDAVFLGTGAGLPMMLDLPGQNQQGIYSANEFLTRVNLMKAYRFPEYLTPVEVGDHVVVIGGGNVAMDSARCALRLGANEVRVIYRRSRDEMPARLEESENAEHEAVIFQFLTNPVRFLGDDQGAVTGIECVKMELGEPDASGRPRPVPIEGSEFVVPADIVIVALGTTPNPLIPATTEGLETTSKGTVVAVPETGLTTRPCVWAGGDLTTGSATVISAMGAGRRAAAAIHNYLVGGDVGETGGAAVLETETTRNCVWVDMGMVDDRICTRNFDCATCEFDREMQAKLDRARSSETVTPDVDDIRKRLQALPGNRRLCRYVYTGGDVSYRLCTRLYDCKTCEFNQTIRDAGEAAVQVKEKAKECVWVGMGMVENRICTRNFDCATCKFDREMQAKLDRVRSFETGTPDIDVARKMLLSVPGNKRYCRCVYSGDVSYRLCSRLYACDTCEFNQMMEDAKEQEREQIYYYIDPEKCQECMICLGECPVQAIVAGDNLVPTIDQEKCIKCGTCVNVCPPRFGAITMIPGAETPETVLARPEPVSEETEVVRS